MMRFWGLIFIFVMAVTVVAQDGLSDDQQALLAEVQAVFERAEAWETYRQSAQETTTLAYTLADSWASTVSVRESAVDVNTAQGITGSLFISDSTLSSETDGEDLSRQADFIISDGEVVLAEGENLTELSAESAEAETLGLTTLSEMTPAQLGLFLENVTAIYDLGVRNQRGTDIQRYELELDVLASLPLLPIELTDLTQPFDGVLSSNDLLDVLAENGNLTLLVAVNRETGQLLSVDLLLDAPVEIPVNETDLLSLEYSYQRVTNYYDVGEPIEIPD